MYLGGLYVGVWEWLCFRLGRGGWYWYWYVLAVCSGLCLVLVGNMLWLVVIGLGRLVMVFGCLVVVCKGWGYVEW